LFIDDRGAILGSLQVAFSDQDVAFAECHSVEDALQAIEKYQPEVIFLDHSLTEGGDEGLEIADQIEGIKIYSTTTNNRITPEYQKRGIENVDKSDLEKFGSIITGGQKIKK